MGDKMMQSESVDKIATALVKFQATIQGVEKNMMNTYFKNKYATLDAIWDAIRKPLTDNGLAIVQGGKVTDHGFVLLMTIYHISGQWISGEYLIKVTKDDAQAYGSAWSYARRYMMSMLGIVSETDDDGEAAVSHSKQSTGIAPNSPQMPQEATKTSPRPTGGFKAITEKQSKRLFAIAMSSGYTKEQFGTILYQAFGFKSGNDVTPAVYEDAVNFFSKPPENEMQEAPFR